MVQRTARTAGPYPVPRGGPYPDRVLKNRMLLVIHLALAVLLALALVACGGGPSEDSSSASPTPTPQSGAAPEASATPDVEGTGPERPAPPGAQQPAIEIASLPVGGDGFSTDRDQCVQVTGSVPEGATIAVTGIRIEPPGVFTVGTFACDGPSCRTFVMTSSELTCHVPVTAQRAGKEAGLSLAGTIRCPAGQRDSCEAFAAAAARSRARVPLFWAPPESQSPSEPPGSVQPESPSPPPPVDPSAAPS